ncbi:MAG TPA: DEAD/DEAH box helicase family protein [Myxococcota bacterium]|nr:DEAD/DEAH box helicase family protein [Myxococcota bacterium]HRV17892.1 DEAD/DEAH box helicase family protein [Myxococcota bacterium]
MLKPRGFQTELSEVLEEIYQNDYAPDRPARQDGYVPTRFILMNVTPGSGKSSVTAIVSARLAERTGMKICTFVPRESLREQTERDYGSNIMRQLFGHNGRIRATKNEADITRGLTGCVSTYQSAIASGGLYETEFDLYDFILVLDECHHLRDPEVTVNRRLNVSAGGELTEEEKEEIEETAYYRAILPLVQKAKLVIFMSGTLMRNNNEKLAFIPYRKEGAYDYIDATRPGWRYIEYTRSKSIAEGATLPGDAILCDGPVHWLDAITGKPTGVNNLSEATEATQSAALYAALRGGVPGHDEVMGKHILSRAVSHWEKHRSDPDGFPGAKLLIIAPDIATCQDYMDYLKKKYHYQSAMATSDMGLAAKQAIARFKGQQQPEVDILFSVAIAYEGLDEKKITHVALLTNYRSYPWIGQAISRFNRAEPTGKKKKGYLFAPQDRRLYEALNFLNADQTVRVYTGRPIEGNPGNLLTILEEFNMEIPRPTPVASSVKSEIVLGMNGESNERPERERMVKETEDNLRSSGFSEEQINAIITDMKRRLGLIQVEPEQYDPPTEAQVEASLRKQLVAAVRRKNVGRTRGIIADHRKMKLENNGRPIGELRMVDLARELRDLS